MRVASLATVFSHRVAIERVLAAPAATASPCGGVQARRGLRDRGLSAVQQVGRTMHSIGRSSRASVNRFTR
jgi:hypothetical protein